jgi:hypothetical protein
LKRAVWGAVCALALTLTACAPPSTPYVPLDDDLAPLRKAFNADAGRTRVLMLVAPTWDICLRGVSEVHAALFAREPDPRLRPIVVWVPKVRGKAASIPYAAERVPDSRVQHFWDGRGALMNAYQRVLDISEDAWDVYLVYGPESRWEGERPPSPRFWMHQLGTPNRPRVRGRYLDVEAFVRETRAVLRSG